MTNTGEIIIVPNIKHILMTYHMTPRDYDLCVPSLAQLKIDFGQFCLGGRRVSLLLSGFF